MTPATTARPDAPAPAPAGADPAWLTYTRQELFAPVQALLDYARWLEEDAVRQCAPDSFQRDAGAIARNCGELHEQVHRLLDGRVGPPGEEPGDSVGFERLVRHELRGPISRILMRCESIEEDADGEIPARFLEDLRGIRAKAAAVNRSVDRLVSFSLGKSAPEPAAAAEPLRLDLSLPCTSRPAVTGRILVVDDNADNRELLQRRLQREGHRVEVAEGGVQALTRLLADPSAIDLVLLDVIMPGMNGHRTLQRIKADPVLRHIPVIMISALDGIENVVGSIEMGAEDYLEKSCDPVLLRARVGASLEKKRLRDRETQLLHALFPPELVPEFTQTGDIRPRRHERVGVLFLDIVGFTDFSERNTPEDVVELLSRQVLAFEQIAERNRAQKVKTIGDAFMCAAGLLRECPRPVESLVRCGLEMIEAARREAGWSVRVGVHVGPVVAGKLGNSQFTYDLWGSTVNLAARMESNGRPGRVTLSPDAWAEVAGAAEAEGRDVAVRGVGPMHVWDFVRFRPAGG